MASMHRWLPACLLCRLPSPPPLHLRVPPPACGCGNKHLLHPLFLYPPFIPGGLPCSPAQPHVSCWLGPGCHGGCCVCPSQAVACPAISALHHLPLPVPPPYAAPSCRSAVLLCVLVFSLHARSTMRSATQAPPHTHHNFVTPHLTLLPHPRLSPRRISAAVRCHPLSLVLCAVSCGSAGTGVAWRRLSCR